MIKYLFFFLIPPVLGAMIYYYYRLGEKEKVIKQKLLQDYREALKSGNKGKALEAGRKYYSALRDNKGLTLYDEQAISNDLSTMG